MKIAAALVCLLFATPLDAHHGYSGFFSPTERTIQVEGRLEALRYANPHVIMSIRARNGRVYVVTWQGATWLENQAHVTRNTFHVGERLVVIGAPARDESSTEVALVREVRRPRDGWEWRSGLSFAPPAHN